MLYKTATHTLQSVDLPGCSLVISPLATSSPEHSSDQGICSVRYLQKHQSN